MSFWKIIMWICAALILFALLGGGKLFAAKSMQTFYVSMANAIPAGAAIRVQGNDRLDALSRLNVTVWTEEEWAACGPCRSVPVFVLGQPLGKDK